MDSKNKLHIRAASEVKMKASGDGRDITWSFVKGEPVTHVLVRLFQELGKHGSLEEIEEFAEFIGDRVANPHPRRKG